jgi:hypothetical protein
MRQQLQLQACQQPVMLLHPQHQQGTRWACLLLHLRLPRQVMLALRRLLPCLPRLELRCLLLHLLLAAAVCLAAQQQRLLLHQLHLA